MDWDKAVAAAWEGSRINRVMKTHLTPELQCFKADNWPEFGYNPAKAKEALAKSKYGKPAPNNVLGCVKSDTCRSRNRCTYCAFACFLGN